MNAEKLCSFIFIFILLLGFACPCLFSIETSTSQVSDAIKIPAEIINNNLAKTPQTIVPKTSWTNEYDVRLALARIYSREKQTSERALTHYSWLLKKKPDQMDVIIEKGQLYFSQKRYSEGLKLLYKALCKHPNDTKLLVSIAQSEAAIGHSKQARDLFLKAVCISKGEIKILIDFADAMMTWGDFFRAEQIYRNALKYKCSLDLQLKLAGSLFGQERYEEAEQLYRTLLLEYPDNLKVLEALARLKIQEKDFEEADVVVESLLCLKPTNPIYLELKAYILFMGYYYNESIEVYNKFKGDPKLGINAYIGLGKAYRKLCHYEEAYEAFEKAFSINPENIEVQYYLAEDDVVDNAFVENLICSVSSPNDLMEWARVYTNNGFLGQSLILYQAILEIDPDHVPAEIALAETLSYLFYHTAALEIYEHLLEEFPQNSKLMVSTARVLAWSKNYEESSNNYNHLIRINPCNPLLYREKAKIALWGKRFNLSMSTYNRLLNPSVDELLLEALKYLEPIVRVNGFLQAIDSLSASVMFGTSYQGYEEFSCWFDNFYCNLSRKEQSDIQQILIDLFSDYLIQKSVALEKRAKCLFWNKRYIHSLAAYKNILDFNPGYEESLFEYGQNFCILGLCDRSRCIYEEILHLDPSHNLVKKALERNEERWRPMVQENFSYWREIGADTFAQSQIARYRLDTVYEQPLSCRARLRLIQNVYVENPFFNFKYYPAQGQTLEADYTVNEYVSLFQNISYRTFFREFKSTFTAHSRLYLNMNDYFQMNLGYDREDIVFNFFSLDQATQADISWVTLSSNLTRYWSAGGTFQFYHYNDHNQQVHYNVTTEYQLTEDPNIFKIIINGDFRNTAHDSILIFLGPELVDVIHPYWTPLNYYSADITLQCRHDYRRLVFCEAPQRYIDLKITGATDSVDNPSIQGIIEWKHDFDRHCGIELKGYIHRSREWNAEGAWGTVYYRF